MTKKQKIIIGIIVFFIIGGIMNAITDNRMEEAENDVTNETKKEKGNNDYEIQKDNLKKSMENIEDYNEVIDSHIEADNNRVSMNLIISQSTSKKQAKELGDSLFRFLASNSNLERPSKNYLGELWEKYTGEIYIGYGPDDVILHGIKNTNRDDIRWYDL